MQLCFDATRFGFGLEDAVELAARMEVPAVEFSFQPFASGRSAGKLTRKEETHLNKVGRTAERLNVQVAVLNLDFCLVPGDRKSTRQFVSMLSKLSLVARALGCQKLAFWLSPSARTDWLSDCQELLAAQVAFLKEAQLRLLVRLSTPRSMRGLSLAEWRPITLKECRALISSVPGLSLSLSPADLVWQNIDYLKSLSFLTKVVDHIECNDLEINREVLADSGLFGPLWWRYRLPGKGQLDWRQLTETLKLYGYSGSMSVHLDDEFLGAAIEDLEDALVRALGILKPLVR